MSSNNIQSKLNRLGFHYYSDMEHYDEASLAFWLPKLISAGTRWIVLPIREEMELPENFVRRIVEHGIEPIIRIDYSAGRPPAPEVFRERMRAYHTLGVHLVQFFTAPNVKSAWERRDWQRGDIVSFFIERYKKYAAICIEQKIIPVFPTLKPGGDYSDLAFLAESIRILSAPENKLYLTNCFLSVNAGFQERETIVIGGVSKTDDGKIRLVPGSQAHHGFHIYEWYNAIVQEIIGRSMPMLLLNVGRWSQHSGPFDMIPMQAKRLQLDLLSHLRMNQEALPPEERIPAYIIATNFYKLPSELAHTSLSERGADKKESFLSRVTRALDDGIAFSEPPAGKIIRSAKTVGEEIDEGLARALNRIFPAQIDGELSLSCQIWRLFRRLIRGIVRYMRRKFKFEGYFLIPDYESELNDDQNHVINLFINSTNVKAGRNLNEAINYDKVILLDDKSLYPSNIISFLQRNRCKIQTLSVARTES